MIKFLRKNYLALVIFTILFHLVLLLKLKFTAWPEILLWPYLNIHGWQLYRDIAVAHTPLMLIKLDFFFRLFGVGVAQLKIFTWVLIFLLDGLVYFLVGKVFNRKVAVAALAFFVFWQVFYEGNGLWFDLFMGAVGFISFYFTQKKNFLLAGIFWALAFISKQTAVWFLLPIGLAAVGTKHSLGGVRAFILGALSIVIPTIFILWFFRILPDFYYWAVKFGISELPRAQGQVQLPDIKNLAISLFPFAILIPLLFSKKANGFSLALWSLAGMLGAYPRFEYFHFQPAVPYLAIASALVLTGGWHKKDLVKAFVPVYVLGCLYLFGGFFMRNWEEGTRFYEKDVQDVAAYVKSNTVPGDKIMTLNYWDSIYALTGTFPATDPWIPQLSWYMQSPGIQEKMVEDLKISKPKLILANPYLETGLASYKPKLVYDYVAANYKLKEKVDGVEILIPR